jgi:hypothetical protein
VSQDQNPFAAVGSGFAQEYCYNFDEEEEIKKQVRQLVPSHYRVNND